jgi:hypothetical protein
MKLDYKMLLNTAIGVAVGMVAYHFISKAMNANGGTVGAAGMRTRRIGGTLKAPTHRCNCTTSDGKGTYPIDWCRSSCDKCCNFANEIYQV